MTDYANQLNQLILTMQQDDDAEAAPSLAFTSAAVSMGVTMAQRIPQVLDENATLNKVLVKFNDTVDDVESAVADILDYGSYAVDFVADSFKGLISIEVADYNVQSVMVTLERSGMVEAVAKDSVMEVADVDVTAADPNDARFHEQYAHQNIQVQEAWDHSTGEGVVVAVVDTGIDTDHPDLVQNLWTNAGEVAGDGIDNDGNGYVDDVHGWNFYRENNNIEDYNGHGTMVAGVISSTANNNIGAAGIAPDAKIMTLNVDKGGGSMWFSDTLQALNYAVQMGATVSNHSYGGFTSLNTPFLNAILDSQSSDHVFVAAAGNNGVDIDNQGFYPASFKADNLISVMATDENNARAGFSNYGDESVDLGAPGVENLTPYLYGGYTYFSGTSSASPHVAAVVALVQSEHPDWTYQQVIEAVFESATPIAGFENLVATGGLLNAYNAVTYGGNPGVPGDVIRGTDSSFYSHEWIYNSDLGDFNVVDFNGDGVLDITTVGGVFGHGFTWIDGTDYSTHRVSYFSPGKYDLADVTGDGVLDVIGNGLTGLIILDGSQEQQYSFITYNNVGTFDVADMDGDGTYEVFSAGGNYKSGHATGNGYYELDGTFNWMSWHNLGTHQVGNFDGDAQLEVLSTSGGSYSSGVSFNGMVLQEITGHLNRYSYDQATDFVIADTNNDGMDELVTNNSNKFVGGVVMSPVHQRDQVTYNDLNVFDVGDLNGDGIKELVSVDGTYSSGVPVGGVVSYNFADDAMNRHSYSGSLDEFVLVDWDGDGDVEILGTGGSYGSGLVKIDAVGANDVLTGTADNDTIIGGGGNDTMTGGASHDVFEFGRKFGIDTITDFGNGNDTLAFESILGLNANNVIASAVISGGDTIINLAAGTITLEDFTGLNTDHISII